MVIQEWFTLEELIPRENRNVLIKVWDTYFAARLNKGRWYLTLSDTYMKAEAKDEWTALR